MSVKGDPGLRNLQVLYNDFLSRYMDSSPKK